VAEKLTGEQRKTFINKLHQSVIAAASEVLDQQPSESGTLRLKFHLTKDNAGRSCASDYIYEFEFFSDPESIK
jgi:hypothetical protein